MTLVVIYVVNILEVTPIATTYKQLYWNVDLQLCNSADAMYKLGNIHRSVHLIFQWVLIFVYISMCNEMASQWLIGEQKHRL